ncbi:MAG TPA: carboxypeptidase-like regulatory domain-containing protein [Gemmatimonadaceae bacterium]|nr:carboxypeptidase-like regulatory domain-containing protein [Gemmatimonadaceae bacterium]
MTSGLLMLSATVAERAQAQEQSTLIIAVSEVAKATPIANAEVSLTELRRRARTGQAGEARLTGIPRGVYEVHVRRLGFAEAAILVPVDRDSVTITVLLRPSTAELDTVHVVESAIVTERHREFEMRRKRGLGRFLGPDDLAKASALEFPIVAIQHFPGLALITGRAGQWQLASRHGSCGVDTSYEVLGGAGGALRNAPGGSRVGGAGSGARQTAAEAATSPSSCFSDHPCHVKLFLDNQPVAESDINIVHTSELYGVEYYANANAPPQYQVSGAACGVILLWTKSGAGAD